MLYMKNYKTILLDENSYNEIKAAKEYLSRQMEKTISFSYVVDRLIGRKMMLLQLQDEILQYITAFVSVMQKYNDVLGILLFGSVAKRTYGKFSDIDMLVVVQNSPGKYFDLAHEAISGLSSFREKLSKISLFLYLSPTVISAGDLLEFKPIFLDIADFGIILYEKDEILTNAIERFSALKHQRIKTSKGEILKWKTN